MDNNQLEIILDIHKELSIVREHMSEVRADLREHIRRTAIIETEVKFLHKQIYIAHGSIALLGLLGVVTAIYKNLV